MRLLLVNATCGTGSTGVIVTDIYKLCSQEGYECFIASPDKNVNNYQNGYIIGGFWDHKLHALLCRISGKQAYFSVIATYKLIRYIKRIRPDVINLHNLHSNYIHLNFLLKELAKTNIKVVITLHDCWFFTGGCYHYTNAHCDKWLYTCGSCPKRFQDTPAYLCDKSSKILKDRYKYFGRLRDLKVVGVSNWIAKESKKSVFKNSDVRTIYNGVDMDVFKPTDSNLRKKLNIEDKFVILGPASKWLDSSNNDALFYFEKSLLPDEVLLLFGCSKKRNDLPENIIQYGFTKDRGELASLYSLSDVFVNLTHEESLSFINLEAQSCGTIVLTYSNTGVSETVDGHISKLVKTDDYEAMLKEIREVKKKKYNKPILECRGFIQHKFEKRLNYLKYIDLFNERYEI